MNKGRSPISPKTFGDHGPTFFTMAKNKLVVEVPITKRTIQLLVLLVILFGHCS